MKEFLKNFFLGSVLMVINLPRLLLGMLLAFIPGYVTVLLLSFVFAPETFTFSTNQGLSEGLSLLISLTGLAVSFFVYAKTKYGALIDRVLPLWHQ